MRDFRDAKAMAHTLRAALATKGLKITVSQSLELIAQAFGVADWKTDWPHPNHGAVPNDGMLVDLIADIAPDDSTRRRMLVDNPAEFFRFR